MFGVICWTILCVLAIRSLLLMFAAQKPVSIRLLDFLFFLFFGTCAALVFTFLRMQILAQAEVFIISFVVLMIPTGILALRRSRQPYVPHPVSFLLKALFVMVVLIACLLAVMMSGFQYLTEDRPVLKVILTGNQKQDLLEWQPPNGIPRKETLTTYEVKFQTPEGEPVTEIYVYGDQVAVKARVLRFRPILNTIGIQNLCKIEYIHNSYDSAKRFNEYPHHAWEIRSAHLWIEPFQQRFWNYWEKYYRQEEKNSWVKSATVESTYFPLVQSDGNALQGAYFLTITSGGLSAIPLP